MNIKPMNQNEETKLNSASGRPNRWAVLAVFALLGAAPLSFGEIVDDFDELETSTPGTTSSKPESSSDSSSADTTDSGAIGGNSTKKPSPAHKQNKPSKGSGKATKKGNTGSGSASSAASRAAKGSGQKGRPTGKVRVVKTAPESAEKTDRNSPITYKADKVLTFKTAKDYSVLNLEKNVFIRQGRLTLSSHRAKVYLRPTKNQANAIDSITINGNVQVQKSSRIPANRVAARGDKAVFRNRQRTVVLTGNAVVVKGEQVVRGNRISYDLKSGNITISGAKGTLKPGGLN